MVFKLFILLRFEAVLGKFKLILRFIISIEEKTANVGVLMNHIPNSKILDLAISHKLQRLLNSK